MIHLQITITGMCMFVPARGGIMHVLMPKTGKHTGLKNNHPVHPHEVRIDVPRQHLGGSAGDKSYQRRLRSGEIQFGTPGNPEGEKPPLPRFVVDITGITGDRVDLSASTNVELAVRLHGGAFKAAPPPAKWLFPDREPVGMSNAVTWTTEIPDGPVVLTHPSFPGGDLKLNDVDKALTFTIGNLPKEEWDPKFQAKRPKTPFWPAHFLGYYFLLSNPSGVVIPTIAPEPSKRDLSREALDTIDTLAPQGRTYSCMTLAAQSSPIDEP